MDSIPDAAPLERPTDDPGRLDQCAGNGLEPIPLRRILERLPDGLEQGFKATLRVGSCQCRLEDGGKDFEGPSSVCRFSGNNAEIIVMNPPSVV